jgi:hypothetical protein
LSRPGRADLKEKRSCAHEPVKGRVMKRTRRICLIAAGVLAALALAGRLVLTSGWAASRVAARLSALCGAPVRVARVDIGLCRTLVRGLRLYERGDDGTGRPWLAAEEMRVGVSLWDVLTGNVRPEYLTLTGCTVLVRLDWAGNLLTHFPRAEGQSAGAVPRLHLRRGRLVFRQDGRPAMSVSEINADLRPTPAGLDGNGSVDDAAWGHWRTAGRVDTATGRFSLTLDAARPVHLTQAMLGSLPYVPAAVWQTVQLDGDTTAEIGLGYRPATKTFTYRLALRPSATRVRVPLVHLDAAGAHGNVLIEDGRVRLDDLRGRAFSGTIATSADLDFRGPDTRFEFVPLQVRGLQVAQVAQRRPGPPWLQGRLTGQARLAFTLGGGRVRVVGSGQGRITDTALGRPVLVRLGSQAQRPAVAPATITLRVHGGDLARVVPALGLRQTRPVTGHVSADFRLTVPADGPATRFADLGAWGMSGRLASPRLQIGAWGLDKFTARLVLRRGTLWVENAEMTTAGTPVSGWLKMDLASPWDFTARADVRGFPLANVSHVLPEDRLPTPLTGSLTAHCDFRGTFATRSVQASGTATATDVAAAGARVPSARCRWAVAGGLLTVTDLHAEMDRGTLAGTGVVPLDGVKPFQADVRFQGIDLGALAGPFVPPGCPVAGRVAGTLKGSVPAGAWDLRGAAADLEMEAGLLRLRGVEAEGVRVTASLRGGAVSYRLQGQGLGGRFDFEARLDAAGRQPGRPFHEGRIRLERAGLGRLLQVLGPATMATPLHGGAELDLAFRQETRGAAPTARGRLALQGLRWDQAEIADQLGCDVTFEGDELRFQDLTAAVGEGLIRGQAAWNTKRPERSWFHLTGSHVEISRLLSPWPAAAAQFHGPVDGRLHGTFWPECHARGQLLLSRGKLAGVEVGEWHIPLELRLSPQTGEGILTVHESTAQVALGRAFAQAALSWGPRTRLEGQVRFFGVELGHLFRQLTDYPQLGSGKLTGRLDFGSGDFHGPHDLSATFAASLAGAQALQYPVLRQVVPYLPRRLTPSSPFSHGACQATLAHGVIRIQRLDFWGSLLQLIVEGSANLQGRLDLEVTALPGHLAGEPGSPSVSERIPLAGPISTGLLVQATRLLAGRLVHLRVTGTVQNPDVRVEPLFLLTEKALRFLATGGR